MDSRETQVPRKKSPLLAALLSAILPGSGFFYLGLITRGFAYMLIFAVLIAVEVDISEYSSYTMEIVLCGLTIAGFYIFQIIDSFNAAPRTRKLKATTSTREAPAETPSMFGSVLILVLGVVFQLESLDMLEFYQIARLWPVILIAVGFHVIISHQSAGKKEEHNE